MYVYTSTYVSLSINSFIIDVYNCTSIIQITYIRTLLLHPSILPSIQYEETPIHLVAKYDHAHIVPIFAAAKADLDLKAKVCVEHGIMFKTS